jgi:FkbM family methyltransferase
MPYVLFEALRATLVALTGNGYNRAPWLNALHHKLGYRLFKQLPRLGFSEFLVVTLPEGGKLKLRTDDGGVGHKLIFYKEYEPFLTQILLRLIGPESTVYNVGANIGYYAVTLGRRVGSGSVVAFEPEPENFGLLEENLEINGLRQVTAVHAALSDRVGTLDLYISPDNFGDHRLHPTKGRQHVAVNVLDWAKATMDFGQPDVLLMDTQGAEGHIIRGMNGQLRSLRLLVIMEYWPGGLRRAGSSAEELLGEFDRAGYTLFEIDEGKRVAALVTTEELLGRDEDQETTLLAVPSEQAPEVADLLGRL